MMENVLASAQGVSLMLFNKFLGWTKEQIEVDLIEVRKEMKNTKIHVYSPM